MTNDRINQVTNIAVANACEVVLDEVCRDSDIGMICAGCMRIASFPDRAAFMSSKWVPTVTGPLIATELLTFDIWADDPQHAEPPRLPVITEWIPAKADTQQAATRPMEVSTQPVPRG